MVDFVKLREKAAEPKHFYLEAPSPWDWQQGQWDELTFRYATLPEAVTAANAPHLLALFGRLRVVEIATGQVVYDSGEPTNRLSCVH